MLSWRAKPHIYQRKSSQSIYAFLIAYIYKSKNPIILKITEFLSSFLLLKNCLSKSSQSLISCGFQHVLSELCTQRAGNANVAGPGDRPSAFKIFGGKKLLPVEFPLAFQAQNAIPPEGPIFKIKHAARSPGGAAAFSTTGGRICKRPRFPGLLRPGEETAPFSAFRHCSRYAPPVFCAKIATYQ